MEVVLVHHVLQLRLPFLSVLDIWTEKLLGLTIGGYEFESEWGAQALVFRLVFRPHHLEDGVEADHESLFELTILGSGVEDGLGGEDECDLGSVILFEPEGGGKHGVDGDEITILLKQLGTICVAHYLFIL